MLINPVNMGFFNSQSRSSLARSVINADLFFDHVRRWLGRVLAGWLEQCAVTKPDHQ